MQLRPAFVDPSLSPPQRRKGPQLSKELTQPKAMSLLRLSESERREIDVYLAREQARRASSHNARASARFRYAPEKPTLIDIPSPGGMQQTYIVLPKDLSATGCALLHGTFTYPGTRCCVTLHTRDGHSVLTPGIIVRCQHVLGRVHELGVRFEHGLALNTFVNVKDELSLGVAAAGMAPPEEFLDTPGVRRLIAELAAISGHRDCPPVLRKKIQDLAKMSDHIEVGKITPKAAKAAATPLAGNAKGAAQPPKPAPAPAAQAKPLKAAA